MPLDQGERSNVKARGWRQGSVLPAALFGGLDNSPKGLVTDRDLLIVISHDCDVTHHSFAAEPNFEIATARAISSTDGNRMWGKSPRKYQFAFEANGHSKYFEICKNEIFREPRSKLSNYDPCNINSLDPECVRSIVRWVAKRYIRASFPDTFNDRVRAAIPGIKKSLRNEGGLFKGIYICTTNEELGIDVQYEAIIWGVMSDEEYEDADKRKDATELLGEIEASIADCDGVTVENAEVRAENQVTISDLNYFKRWDFDDLSLRDGDGDVIPQTDS